MPKCSALNDIVTEQKERHVFKDDGGCYCGKWTIQPMAPQIIETTSLSLDYTATLGILTNKRHLDIVRWIDAQGDRQWSIAELLKVAPGRRATLYQIIARLVKLGYVGKVDAAWQKRVYWKTEKWKKNGATQVVSDYELYMLVRISAKDLK